MQIKTPSKKCKSCGNLFYKKNTTSRKAWTEAVFCSRSCINKGRRCPWGGKKLPWDVWNKGKTGVQVAWNKGLHYEQVANEKHYLWKGKDATMTAQHQWIYRRLGQPQECSFCGMNDPNRKYHWSNISGKYLRDVGDYQRLCVPCHKKYDLARIKKTKNGRK